MTVDRERTRAAIAELIDAWGLAADPRLERTADRVADASAELLAGEGIDPVPALREGRIPAADSDLVLVRNISFSSMCEHHLLPFDGWIHLAYLPGSWITGFGRIHNLVATCTARLALQERIGEQLVDALMTGLDARGALAVVEARQNCVAARGPKQRDSEAVSVAARGTLLAGDERAEAFRLIALGGTDRDSAADAAEPTAREELL